MKRFFTIAITCLLLQPVFTLAATNNINRIPTNSLAPMLSKVLPSVVNIYAVGQANPNQEPTVDANGKPQPPHKFLAVGSGVIIDSDHGLILTNSHVVRGADTITVTLNNGVQSKAKVIGLDPPSDVAVIQINTKNLVAISIANSDQLKVGDFVVAIGSPFGLNQSVTSGIVSGLQRSDLGIEGYENFIQTDAPINPGNSGGALVNLNGQLVGINTAIVGPNGTNIGIGFAIPSNMARSITMQILKYGEVQRGLLGIMIQSLTPSLADAFNLPNRKGVVVSQVNANSPAAQAGIKSGDIIESINGQNVTEAAQVTNVVGLMRVGTTVNLNVLRNGKTQKFSVTLASPKQYLHQNEIVNRLLFGINMRDFSQLNVIHGPVQGVQVVAIAEESPAAHATPTGLHPGDVIISANIKPVHNIHELMTISQQNNKQLLLNILRGNDAVFVVVS
jgi:serine protease Do